MSSPDARVTISIAADASRFSFSRNGEMVIAPSALGLDLDVEPELSELVLEKREDVKVESAATHALIGMTGRPLSHRSTVPRVCRRSDVVGAMVNAAK